VKSKIICEESSEDGGWGSMAYEAGDKGQVFVREWENGKELSVEDMTCQLFHDQSGGRKTKVHNQEIQIVRKVGFPGKEIMQ